MSGIQQKIIRHAKEANITHNQGKNQSLETEPEMTKMKEFAERMLE